MSDAELLDMLRSGLWTAFIIATPPLTAALISGTLIGLFQALTSIQELTLTFVPKLAAIFIVFWISMGFMSQSLIVLYQDQIIENIARN